ncbi:MAG: hypothetical protein Q4D90_03200 [bacterium]|nr:hypothetical protein [bacterium]
MGDIEFAQKLVKEMDKKTLQAALRLASKNGFVVQGFTKNLHLAPISRIVAAMEKRKKGMGVHQSSIFLCAVAELDGDSQPVRQARKWTGSTRGQLELIMDMERGGNQILLQTEKVEPVEQREEKEENQEESKAGKESQDEEAVEQREAMAQAEEKRVPDSMPEEKAEALEQGKIKKLQAKLQELKIGADNLNREKEQLKKDRGRLERNYIKAQADLEGLREQCKSLEAERNEYRQQKEEMQKELERYQQLFERLPKVLCFSKKQLNSGMFPLNRIEQHREWEPELAETVDWKEYREIWVTECDFSYPEVCLIRKAARGKLVVARNLSALITKVGGIHDGYAR